jgi:8-oxo-dGTP diphosphatase
LIKRKVAPYKGKWALPGGLVLDKESLDQAVERELKEETGIDVNYLEQLYSFGSPKRDPRNRVISVAYFALVRKSNFKLHAATDAEEAKWINIKDLPKLAFDHNKIIDVAVNRLRGKIGYEPIGFELLDEKFPFSDLHKLYELVYNRSIDRRNFKKKFLQLNILEELDEKISKGKGRPGSLFRFNKAKYFKLKESGVIFEV